MCAQACVGTAIRLLHAPLAAPAQKAIAAILWPTRITQLDQNGQVVVDAKLSAVSLSAAFDVVKREKRWLRLTAASAMATEGGERLSPNAAQPDPAIVQRIRFSSVLRYAMRAVSVPD